MTLVLGLTTRIARLAQNHPQTLTTRYDLAGAYKARGESARAEPLLRDVFARRKKKFGVDHPDFAMTLFSLGRNLLEQRKWGAAEPLLREGLAIWEAKRPGDWNRFENQSLFGGCLLGQGR